MNINDLPLEVLEHVLRQLSVRDVYECSRVCLRWQSAAHGLGEDYWKKACREDHGNVYNDAYLTASLSWRHLYTSLSLWAEVQTAEVTVRVIAEGSGVFQALRDGVVACAHCFKRKEYPRFYYKKTFSYETIVYYDLNTQEEINREEYGLDTIFQSFEENDLFIVVVLTDPDMLINYLHVTLKSNRTSFVYGRDAGICSWLLTDDEMYFEINKNLTHLYRVRVVVENEEPTLVADDIRCSRNVMFVKALASINSRQINLLTVTGGIYSLIGYKVRKLAQTYYYDDELTVLHQHGFSWRTSYIFDYLSVYLPIPTSSALFIYNKVVFIAQTYMLHIYYNPYNSAGKLSFEDATPAKSFDFSAFARQTGRRKRGIDQISVVEALGGHNVIVSCSHKIFLIEFRHKFLRHRHNSSSSSACTSPLLDRGLPDGAPLIPISGSHSTQEGNNHDT